MFKRLRLMAIAILAMLPVVVLSAEVGKIKGKIVDKETGEALFGTNVVIKGAALGAAVDMEGKYEIENVAPGTHTIIASMMGYRDEVKKDIIVRTGETTTLNFALFQTAISMKGVTVTATKTRARILDTPSPISVVSAKDIERIGGEEIADVLKYMVPGINVSESGTAGSSVILRGFSSVSGYTLILVDGMPLSSNTKAYCPALAGDYMIGIQAEDVERVEVLRGPASALYGAKAKGGVINIITKKKASGPKVTVKSMYGNIGNSKFNLSLRNRVGKTGYRLTATTSKTGGWRQNGEGQKNNVDLHLNTLLDSTSNLKLGVSYHYFDRAYPAPISREDFENNPDTSYMPPWAGTKEQGWKTSLIYDKLITDKLDLTARGNISLYRFICAISSYYDHPGNDEELELQLTSKYPLFERENTFTAGVVGRHEYILYSNYGVTEDGYPIEPVKKSASVTAGNSAVYAQNELRIIPLVNLVVGARYQVLANIYEDLLDTAKTWDITDAHLSPKVGATFNVTENISLYGSWADGFNFPTFGKWKYNPDLKPEKGWGSEIGVKTMFENGMMSLGAFRTDIEDKLVYNYAWEEKYKNLGEVRHQGIEFEAEFEPLQSLSINANYAYLDAKIVKDEAKPETEGKMPYMTSPNRVGANIFYHPTLNSGLKPTVGIAATWVDKYYTDNENTEDMTHPSYIESTAKAGLKWKKYSATIVVDNVLDEHYAQYGYYYSYMPSPKFSPTPGRNYRVEVGVSF